MRLQATRTSVTSAGGAGDALYRAAGGRPTLDQRFAKDKTLVDKVSGENLITFSRASSGTYVDSDGLIKNSPVNLLTYSEQFDQWTVVNTTITPNAGVAPDGTNTADLLPAGNTQVNKQLSSSGTATVFSVWVKSAVAGVPATSRIYHSIGVGIPEYFQEFTTTDAWQRISVNRTGGSASPIYYQIGQWNNQNGPTQDMLIWGAQVEEGTTATDYIPTGATISGAPRFDHDPATGESLGLLFEEARTNLSPDSADFSFWDNAGLNLVSDDIVSPDGTQNADKISLASHLSDQHNLLLNASKRPTLSAGSAVSVSCFVKDGNARYFQIRLTKTGTNIGSGYSIDLNTLLELSSQSQAGTPSGLKIESYENGWLRVSFEILNVNPGAQYTPRIGISNASGDFQFSSGTSTDYLYIWGAQFEAGSFPTSYIPTSGSTVTRSPDSALIVGNNFSSWYNQSEGTFVTIASSVSNLDSTVNRSIFQVSNSTIAQNVYRQFLLYRGPTKAFFISSRDNSLLAFSPPVAGDPSYDNDTLAYGYSSSEISKVFSDGSQISSTPSIVDWSTYNSDRLAIGSGGGLCVSGHISRFAYFPTLKTDQELINVTGGDTAIPIITYGITSAGGTFNLRSTGTVDYSVDWDSTGGYESSTSNTLAHTYAAGNHSLVVYSNDVYRPYFDDVTADVNQITSVVIGVGANLGDNINKAWLGAINMTTFESSFAVTGGVSIFTNAWRKCSSLTSFPLIDTSSATSIGNCWRLCNSLTSFPKLDLSSVVSVKYAWRNCSSLTSFPAKMFDTTGTLYSTAFDGAFFDCALTTQSIENILVSLDTNGQSNILLGIQGGTNAAKTTWSTAANTAYDNLITKGWTITFVA